MRSPGLLISTGSIPVMLKKRYKYLPEFRFKDVFDPPVRSETGVFYIGYDKNRLGELERLAAMLNLYGIRNRFILIRDREKEYRPSDNVEFIDEYIDYSEVLRLKHDYSCLLELCVDGMRGLSLRAVSALFGHKKLITNTLVFYGEKVVSYLKKRGE